MMDEAKAKRRALEDEEEARFRDLEDKEDKREFEEKFAKLRAIRREQDLQMNKEK